jgi:RNA polymerase sigma factor (sigma-70 family)
MSASDSDRPHFELVASTESAREVEEIYRRHGEWLVSFLRRRFGQQSAEDLAQETFSRIVSQTSIREPRKFLAHVAIRAARDQFRRQAVRPFLVSEGEAFEQAATPAEAAEAMLQKQIIQALPARLRQAFLLRSFTPMTNAEIAEHLGVSVKTVEERVNKALAICKVLLRD